MIPDTREDWLGVLRFSVENTREQHPIPPRSSLSPLEEMQCRVLGGHLIRWLREWGPAMIAERNVVAYDRWEKDPFIIFTSNLPGLVAAREILPPLQEIAISCSTEEYREFCEIFPDPENWYHCVLEAYFVEPTPEQAAELRQRFSLDERGSLWILSSETVMGPRFVRGGKTLLRYVDGDWDDTEESLGTWMS